MRSSALSSVALGSLWAPACAFALFCAATGAEAADAAPSAAKLYLKYCHPTIAKPFPDLLRLDVPGELENRRLAELGYVDVTQGPFRADPSGATDSTRAIQDAVIFARDRQMACFFPPGTYLLSDTLECVQQLYMRSNGKAFGGNRFPVMLIGSRAGAQRPTLRLAPNSAGFGDPRAPKIFVRFWSRGYLNETTADRVGDGLPPDVEQPNIGMNQVMANLAIEIGEGNRGAIAVRHQAAEGSGIFDCAIDATHALIGLQGGSGSGGGSAGVTVVGGRIGLDFTGYMGGTQPTPTITGFTLIGQSEAAIRSTSRQTLVAAGLKILADRCAGPLIQVGAINLEPWMSGPGASPLKANHGELTLVDAQIEFAGEALNQSRRVAIESDRGVYLNNVFVRGATHVLVDPERQIALSGNPEGWLRVGEYAHASAPRGDQGNEYRYPVYVDGQPVESVSETEADRTPPADLQARHLWPADLPHFESAGAANVKEAPYRAKGDGLADDTDAIRKAIDENEIVFFPKGCYRLTQTLELKPNSKLIGVGQTMSLLLSTGDGAFGDAQAPAPLVRTANAAQAETTMAFLGLTAPGGGGVQALHWRCGGRSILLSVEFWRIPSRIGVLISDHGGGNWYNMRGTRTGIEGAQGPLHFYQFSCQQVTSELKDARNIRFFGTKYEGNSPNLWIRDCDNIAIYGHGGNGKGRGGASLFSIERTPNFLFANAVDGPTRIGSVGLSSPEGSTDPRFWHMLIERFADGTEFKLPPMERPVLYKRGTPGAGGEAAANAPKRGKQGGE